MMFRRQETDIMDQRDFKPPYPCNTSFLRKAHQNSFSKIMPGTYPITSLSFIKYWESYAGSIHDSALDKVLVHCLPQHSFLCLKVIGRIHTLYCTGHKRACGAKKIVRPHNLLGNILIIFIYQEIDTYLIFFYWFRWESNDLFDGN